MSNIIQLHAPLTMTSREIAELTGKEIAHIHRDIRIMLEQLGDDPELEHVQEDKDARGYTACFHLTKNLSMTLVAGYNVKLRKTIIDRWQHLEAQAAKPLHLVPQSLPEALRLAADLAEQKAQAEAALAIAAPKAAALDLIAAGEDAVTLREAAKLLSIKEDRLTTWMHANGWVYRLNSRWVAYQKHIESGHLKFKEASFTSLQTGQKVFQPYCHILPKGMSKLATVFAVREPA